MKQLALRLYLVVAALLLLGSVLWAGGNQTSATTFIWDQSGDKIRSDGRSSGYYYNGVDCVQSWVDGSGNYFFRSTTVGCPAATPRSIVLDFSGWVVTRPSNCTVFDALGKALLDICGANTVPDVRLTASKMFSSNALLRGVPVKLLINISTGAFELDFEQNAYVAGGLTSRTLSVGAANDIAELYQINGKKKVSLGRFHMPFAMTMTQ